MNKGRWTKEEIESLKKLYQEKSAQKIALILDRSLSSVISKIYKLGLIKYTGEKFTIECKHCNRTFKVNKSRKDVALFCSRKCKGAYTKQNSGSIRKCQVCNTEFYAYGNPKGRRLCSTKCRAESKKTGSFQTCSVCGNDVYIRVSRKAKAKNVFCGKECADVFQTGDKITLNCKICSKPFEVYPSDIKHSKLRGQTIQYCSVICRDNDPAKMQMLIDLNHLQNRSKKRNKLEEAGYQILQELEIDFVEQYLINDKISVDIYIPKANLIIEWWGDYWHGHSTKLKNGRPDRRQKKRMALDVSQKQYFKKCGYELLTFWEHEVYSERENVKEIIRTAYNNVYSS